MSLGRSEVRRCQGPASVVAVRPIQPRRHQRSRISRYHRAERLGHSEDVLAHVICIAASVVEVCGDAAGPISHCHTFASHRHDRHCATAEMKSNFSCLHYASDWQARRTELGLSGACLYCDGPAARMGVCSRVSSGEFVTMATASRLRLLQ